jgi:hypothetical protein
MANERLNNEFDTQRYILENIIFKKNSDFLEQQIILQSLNKMGGRIFNPFSFALNLMGDDKTKSDTITQLIASGASSLLAPNPNGIAYTTDGQTFGRALDNNIPSTFYKDAIDVKNATGGSFLKNISNQIKSAGAQSLGFEKPYRSILGQALSYSGEGINLADAGLTGGVQFVEGLGSQSIPLLYGESITRRVQTFLNQPDIVYPAYEVEIPKELVESNRTNVDITPIQGRLVVFLMRRLNRSKTSHKNLTVQKLKEIQNKTGQQISLDSDKHIDDSNTEATHTDFNIPTEYRKQKDTENRNPSKNFTNPLNPLINPSIATSNDDLNIYSLYTTFKNNSSFDNKKRLVNNNNLDDVVNVLDIQNNSIIPESLKDTLYMRITDLRTNKTIYLRPTMESISEDMQTSFTQNLYLGRTESIPSYETTSRGLTFPLKLYAQTPNELLIMWKKIEFIKSLMYPIASPSFASVKSPMVELTIGDIYRNLKGVINSVSTTIDLTTVTWEMEKGKTSPKIVDLTIAYSIIHDSMPYSLSDNKFANNVFMHHINEQTEDAQ